MVDQPALVEKQRLVAVVNGAHLNVWIDVCGVISLGRQAVVR
jgi:hypothetical protein